MSLPGCGVPFSSFRGEVAGPGSASRVPGSPDPSLPHTEDPGRGGPGGEGSAPAPEDVSLDGVDPGVFTPEELVQLVEAAGEFEHVEFEDGELSEEEEAPVSSCLYKPVADEYPLIDLVLHTEEGLDEQVLGDTIFVGDLANGRKAAMQLAPLADGMAVAVGTMEMSDTSKVGLHYITSEPEDGSEFDQLMYTMGFLLAALEDQLAS